MNKILPYSAINRKANLDPPYSILNPETNSLSPSAKSKGARLVSAKIQNTHKHNKAGRRAKIQKTELASLNLSRNKIITSNARAITTSYEIVWAEARTLPSKAYLELLAQPERRRVKTFKEETLRKKIIPHLNLIL